MRKRVFYLVSGLLILLGLTSTSCVQPLTQVERILERGELRVVTTYSPTTYFIDTDSETGFEYELARLFAGFLNVRLKVIIAENKADMVESLRRNEADIAVGLLKRTHAANQSLVAGPEYYSVNQLIIYKNGLDRPRKPADLYPYQVHIAGGLVSPDRLQTMKAEDPEFSWKIHPDQGSLDLIELVQEEQIAYAAVYSNELSLARQTYPELRSAFDISEPGPLSWFMKKSADFTLVERVDAFFAKINANENLAELIEYFYGTSTKFDYVDQRKFIERYGSRLPQYLPLFVAAGEKYDFDWRLLAAMSYQESHWNERARSPTGVRGLMMLTLDTARQVDVVNRLDPEQSIMGGARYIRHLVDAIPERIEPPDSIWLALAAYNIGFGHLEDARKLTQKRGGNPDKWQEVREALPLLQHKDWYRQTLFGYARGNEAVRYVDSIRKYYQTLVHLTRGEFPTSPPPEPVKVVDFETLAL